MAEKKTVIKRKDKVLPKASIKTDFVQPEEIRLRTTSGQNLNLDAKPEDIKVNIKNAKLAVNTSLFKRFLSFVIDMVVVVIIMMPLSYQIAASNPNLSLDLSLSSINNYLGNFSLMMNIVMSLVMLFYFAILESIVGQTLGKAIFGIYVISPKKKNFKVSFFQAAVRVLPFLPLFNIILIVDVAAIFFNRRFQRLCEILSKTFTVSLVDANKL